jgi:hypothetical protein
MLWQATLATETLATETLNALAVALFLGRNNARLLLP